MRGRLALLTATGLVTAGTVLPGGPAAAATPVTCGAHLTANATLTTDLTCAAGDGITLDAGVTLDLGGHRLTGPGGVTVSAGVQGAVVRNGRVQGASVRVGELGEDQASATVRNVTMAPGSVSVSAGTVTVERSRFLRGGGVGTFMGQAVVRDSLFDGGGVSAGMGQLSVSRSTIRNADTAMYCSESGCELIGSRVENNDIAYDGWGSRVTMRGNLARNNGVGYHARDPFGHADSYVDTLENNHFAGNDVAVHLDWGVGVAIRRNLFTGNGRGVELEALDEPGFSYRVLLERNTLARNGDAIYVPDTHLPTVTGFSLKGNRAIRNTGWGIYAPRAEDLGGNVARGNGNQPQCVGVAC